jgi:hypothetical protein
MPNALRNISVFHKDANKLRQMYKNGIINRNKAMNNLNRVYSHAEKYFYNHLPKNAAVRNRNANKLQEIMRWSQGHWNYKARK